MPGGTAATSAASCLAGVELSEEIASLACRMLGGVVNPPVRRSVGSLIAWVMQGLLDVVVWSAVRECLG